MAIDYVANHHIDLGTFEIAGSALTLMGWVRRDGAATDPRMIMKGTGTASASHWWGMNLNGGTNQPQFRLFTGSYTALTGSTVLGVGTWYHLAGTYDGSNMRIFVDGVEEASTGKTGAIRGAGGAVSVWIGDQPGASGARDWNGGIEDVRAYARTLNPNEIATIYAARGGDGILSGLEGWWPQNEGAPGVTVPAAAGTVRDLSPFGRNGTQSGNPVYDTGILVGTGGRRRAS